MGLASGSYIACKNRKLINKSILKTVIIWVFIGMIISTPIYSFVDYQILIYLYGVMIVVISLKKIFVKKEINISDKHMKIVLMLGGVIHGLLASGGPLIIVYLVSVIKRRKSFGLPYQEFGCL